MLKSFYGTPLYLSPELVDNLPYNEKTDIWSLGVILYEMCALRPPFIGSSLLAVAKLVQSGSYAPIPAHYSKYLHRCIAWLLNIEYAKRPNMVQLLDFVAARLPIGYRGEDLQQMPSTMPVRAPLPNPNVVVPAGNNIIARKVSAKIISSVGSDDDTADENDSINHGTGNKKAINNDIEERCDKAPEQSCDSSNDEDSLIGNNYNNHVKQRRRQQQQQQHNRRSNDNTDNRNRRQEHQSESSSSKNIRNNEVGSAISALPAVVTIDAQRLQVLLRRELAQVRKLLQMKNFVADVDNSSGSRSHSNSHGSSSSSGQQQQGE